MKNKTIGIIIQAFYGNRTYTETKEEDIDYIVLGYLDKSKISPKEKFDRTIIRIPNSKCVLLYNKYQEETYLSRRDPDYTPKPLATIPELNLSIYSRCFICRIDDNGNLESIQPEDNDIISKYLAR